MKQLDPRLLTAASLVREHAVFADIGCDHGHLSIYLMQQRHAQRGYACDIKSGPLSKAQSNLAAAGLSQQVPTRLTDGLTGLDGCGITDVVIAGMGGEVILQILDASALVRDPALRLILQPQSREFLLRRYLLEHGFSILTETAVFSGRFSYTVLCAQYAGAPGPDAQDPYRWYAGLLPQADSPAAADKLIRTAVHLEDRSHGVPDPQQAAQFTQLAARLRQDAAQILARCPASC